MIHSYKSLKYILIKQFSFQDELRRRLRGYCTNWFDNWNIMARLEILVSTVVRNPPPLHATVLTSQICRQYPLGIEKEIRSFVICETMLGWLRTTIPRLTADISQWEVRTHSVIPIIIAIWKTLACILFGKVGIDRCRSVHLVTTKRVLGVWAESKLVPPVMEYCHVSWNRDCASFRIRSLNRPGFPIVLTVLTLSSIALWLVLVSMPRYGVRTRFWIWYVAVSENVRNKTDKKSKHF